MFNSHQIEKLISENLNPNFYQPDFDDISKDFLKFLIEIVLEINAKQKIPKKNSNKLFIKKKKNQNKTKSFSNSQEKCLKNKVLNKNLIFKPNSQMVNNSDPMFTNLPCLNPNIDDSVLNSNIINTNNMHTLNQPSVTPHLFNHTDQSSIIKPNNLFISTQQNNPAMNKNTNNQLFFEENSEINQNHFEYNYSNNQENNIFEDFEKKFIEANLHKVISLEELRTISQAIGHKDWGYIKYILTIICMMLKSYQNIRENCNENMLESPQNKPKNDLTPNQISSSQRFMPLKPNENNSQEKIHFNKVKQINSKKEPLITLNDFDKQNESSNKLIIPQQRTAFKVKTMPQLSKDFSSDQINEQLISLQNVFQKMKNVNVQMNVSSCWACQQNTCSYHQNGKESGDQNNESLNLGQRSFFKNFDQSDFNSKAELFKTNDHADQ
jgi:hypothetical protein